MAAHDLLQPDDAKGSAYGELGEIHALLGNFEQAISCMDRQLGVARYGRFKLRRNAKCDIIISRESHNYFS